MSCPGPPAATRMMQSLPGRFRAPLWYRGIRGTAGVLLRMSEENTVVFTPDCDANGLHHVGGERVQHGVWTSRPYKAR